MDEQFISKYSLSNSQEFAPSKSYEFIQTHVEDSDVHGKQLITDVHIQKGSTVAIDGGVVTTSVADLPADKRFAVAFHSGLFLAPASYEKPENLCFINHSCTANLARIGGLVFIAKQDIKKGEELSIDYAPLVSHLPEWKMTCECGAATCRKLITGLDWKNPRLAQELFMEWLPEIQRRLSENYQNEPA